MRLLIVGSLQGHITEAGKIAMGRGAKVAHASSIDKALSALRSGHAGDIVMVDVQLDIASLVQSLKSERISVPVIACGVGTDAKAAVNAIHAGAKEYVPLPPDADLIAAVLEAIAEESHAVICEDPATQDIFAMAEQVAAADATVLVTGESGTGKEVMARFIHRKSRRANGPFISLNCATIPESLLESELFGHEKGAFTGAIARRIGKFEEANGGTLLLDEISEMHPHLQAKLLRAIQERQIDRVGGNQPVKVDIRLIATSNRDLEAAVEDGSFREDLYYRLNVVNLRMPALRERPGDIPALAAHFAHKYCDCNGVPAKALGPDALDKLAGHGWRGNVRELENTIHRAVLITRGDTIGADQIVTAGPTAGAARPLGGVSSDVARRMESAAQSGVTQGAPNAAESANRAASMRTGAPDPHLPPIDSSNGTGAGHPANGHMTSTLVGRTVADVERDLILETLDHCLGNRTQAANILGISIRTLRNKLKQYSETGALPHARRNEQQTAY